jgi:phosphoglycerate dehydrogenase-like enzyme
MKTAPGLNIIVARAFREALPQRVIDVTPGARVTDISAYSRPVYGNDKPAVIKWQELMGTGKTDEEIRRARYFQRKLREADVMLGAVLARDVVSLMPSLKWVQLTSAGVDYLSGTGLLESKRVTVTTAGGCAAVAMAEYVMGTVLVHAKGILKCVRNMQEHHWERFAPVSLYGKTIGIIGAGNIGREVARLAKAFHMKTLGLRLRARSKTYNFHGIDELYPPPYLGEVLSRSDYVVLSLPLTAKTYHLIDGEKLRLMKPTAFLVNVSRGSIIDEPQLVSALRNGRIAGAALDVFEKEPLPDVSPLWDLPNVLLSPHISAASEHYLERVLDLFLENLKRFRDGRKLLNVYNSRSGY